MKAKIALAVLLVVGCASAMALDGCSGSPESLYEAKCSACHPNLDQFMDMKSASYSSLEDWTRVTASMQDETDTISDADVEVISQYLYDRYSEK